MVFTKRLRAKAFDADASGAAFASDGPHVKAGGRYPMDDGHIVVDSIVRIRLADITADLAQESGFDSVKDLLQTAKRSRQEDLLDSVSVSARGRVGRASPNP